MTAIEFKDTRFGFFRAARPLPDAKTVKTSPKPEAINIVGHQEWVGFKPAEHPLSKEEKLAAQDLVDNILKQGDLEFAKARLEETLLESDWNKSQVHSARIRLGLQMARTRKAENPVAPAEEKKDTVNQIFRAMELASVALALLGTLGSGQRNSVYASADTGSYPARPPMTAEPPEATVAAIQATTTPDNYSDMPVRPLLYASDFALTKTPVVEPQPENRKSFMLGKLDLGQPFTFIDPQSGQYLAEVTANKTADMSPEVSELVGDYRTHPDGMGVFLTEPGSDALVILMHTFNDDNGHPLPGNNLLRGKDQVGTEKIILQTRPDGSVIRTVFQVTERQEISLAEFKAAAALGEGGEYGFYRTDKLLLSKPDLIIAGCNGRKITVDGKPDYSERSVAGLILMSQEVVHSQRR